MATVVTLYIKPKFLASVSPVMIDDTVIQTAQLISEKITVTSQVLFSLVPLQHCLAHSLSIQVTVQFAKKPKLDINIVAARSSSILCMVKTGGRVAGVRHKQELEILLPKSGLAAQSQISLHSSSFISNHSHSPSVSLCLWFISSTQRSDASKDPTWERM